jgi:hypothetical protein
MIAIEGRNGCCYALTMHAFDFILVLFSFVYAAAVTHVFSTAGRDHHRLQAHPTIVADSRCSRSLGRVTTRLNAVHPPASHYGVFNGAGRAVAGDRLT